MDVLHCDWSPCDTMLASCSIDNTVRLWLMPWAAAGATAGADGSYGVMLTPFRVLRGELSSCIVSPVTAGIDTACSSCSSDSSGRTQCALLYVS
jgi:hypothetical protein